MNTNDKAKRIINLRKPFVIFVSLMMGIILSYFFCINLFLSKNIALYLVIYSFIFIFFMFCLIVFIFRKRIKQNKFFSFISKEFLLIVLSLIVYVIGTLTTTTNINLYVNQYKIEGVGNVVATIDLIEEYEYGYVLKLSDLQVEIEDNNYTIPLAQIYVDKDKISSEIGEDYLIKFIGKFTNNNPLNKSKLEQYFQGYGCEINVENNVEIFQQNITLRSKILKNIRNVIYNNMSKTNGNLTYTMLFGDKCYLDNDINDVFSIAGVSHLLAVSGLHVGVISMCIIFIITKLLKCFKLKTNVKNIIILIFTFLFLLFYAYLCAFSISVCRASIMIIVYLICKLFGKKYDVLNSLSIAGIIILLISPLSLFEVGFQLSFLCIFSIITLVPKLTKLTNAIHVPQFISLPLLTSFAINLITFPVVVNVFGKTSLWSVISNIFIIPLFSIIYPIVFFCVVISSIFPFISFILFIPNILIHILRFIVTLFASLPGGAIECFRVGYVCLALIILFSFLFKYLMSTKGIKSIVLSTIAVASILIITINMLPANYSDTMFVKYSYSNLSVVSEVNGKTIIIGYPDKHSQSFLRQLKINTIDYLVLDTFEFNDVNNLSKFCCKYKIKDLYIPSIYTEYNSYIDCLGVNIIYFGDEGSNSLGIKYLKNATEKYLAISIQYDKLSLLYINNNLTNADYYYLSSELGVEEFSYCISVNEFDTTYYDIKVDNFITCENSQSNKSICLSDFEYCDIKL